MYIYIYARWECSSRWETDHCMVHFNEKQMYSVSQQGSCTHKKRVMSTRGGSETSFEATLIVLSNRCIIPPNYALFIKLNYYYSPWRFVLQYVCEYNYVFICCTREVTM